jgi:spore maturation protein B
MSNYLIPLIICLTLFAGYKNKVNIYESFLVGAKEGLKTMLAITPNILAMTLAINLFLHSGVANLVVNLIKNFISVPYEIIMMCLFRPVSGSATLAILNNILTVYGPDSFYGNLGSTIQGCTDTTIYVLALYFGSINVTKTKYALPVGLFADLVGITMAFIIANIFFK